MNEYIYHNDNTNTNVRFETDEISLQTFSQSKLNISTDITLDGGQTLDTNIGKIILKTTKNTADAIQINAQHTDGGITLDAGSNGISLDSTGNSNFTSSAGTLTLSGNQGINFNTSSTMDLSLIHI